MASSRIALAVVLTVLTTGAYAQAQPASPPNSFPISVGNWSGGAFEAGEPKQFSNCRARVRYNSGASITLLMTAGLTPMLFVEDPKFELTEGEKVDVTVKLVNIEQGEFKLTGAGASKTMLRSELPPMPDAFNSLARTTDLAVETKGAKGQYNIGGIRGALPKVIECALNQRAKMAAPPSAKHGELSSEERETQLMLIALIAAASPERYRVMNDKTNAAVGDAAKWKGNASATFHPEAGSNYLVSARWNNDTKMTRAALVADVNALEKKVPGIKVAVLPQLEGIPESFAFSVTKGPTDVREFYMIRRGAAGWMEFYGGAIGNSAEAAEAAATNRAAFAKALATVIPYK